MKKPRTESGKTWFTADTHFGHANIIKYCNRPFANADEMDRAMIENWNQTVKEGDTVYHLGDFGMEKSEEEFYTKLSHALNGRIVLVRGNHDQAVTTETLKRAGIVDAGPLLDIEVVEPNGKVQHIVLCHYAMRVWNRSHHGSWHLYGHTHGTLEGGWSLSMDVGVDCWSFRPISYYTVKGILAAKENQTPTP